MGIAEEKTLDLAPATDGTSCGVPALAENMEDASGSFPGDSVLGGTRAGVGVSTLWRGMRCKDSLLRSILGLPKELAVVCADSEPRRVEMSGAAEFRPDVSEGALPRPLTGTG